MRLVRVLVLLILLGGSALAQYDPKLEGYFNLLEAQAQQQNIGGMADLVVSDPRLALQAFQLLAQMFPTMEREDQMEALFIANVIARTCEVRLRDASLTQYLVQQKLSLPESAWDGTALARGAAGPTGPGTPGGPGTTGGPPGPGPTGPSYPSPGGPVLASTPLGQVQLGLRVGNYADAAKVAQANRGDRLQARYLAAAWLGMGRPLEALRLAEALLAKPVHPDEQLRTELLACQAAYAASLPKQFAQHVKAARALLSKIKSGPYADVAAFLVESYEFDIDLTAHAEMPASEILRRHDKAWAHLANLSRATKDQLADLTSELFWVGDLYWQSWFLNVGQMKLDDSDPQVKQVGPKLMNDLTQMIAWGQALTNQQHFELYFRSLALLEGFVAIQQGAPESLADAGKQVLQLDKLVRELYQGCEQIRQSVGEGFPISPTRGSASQLMAELYLLKARQLLAEHKSGVSDTVANQIEEHLKQAGGYAQQADRLDTLTSYLTTQLDFYTESQPQGWQQRADETLAAWAKAPALMETRSNQYQYYYRLGKLREQENRRAEAAVALQKAVDILENFINEVGGSARSAQAQRTFVKDLYESLARVQIQEGKNPEAFQTIGRLQQVEAAGTFTMADMEHRVKPQDKALIAKTRDARASLQSQEQEVAALKQAGAPAAEVQKASQVLASNRAAYFQCVTDLETRYPEFKQLDIRPINFSKLQRALPKDTLVLQLFPTERDLFLMEATSDNLVVRKVAVSQAELNRLVGQYRRQVVGMADSQATSFDWNSPQGRDLRETGGKLYSLLIAPIEGDLATHTNLAIIPYGSLMYLPFPALAAGGQGTPEFLIQKHPVVVLCKATDLDQVFGHTAGKTGSLVALGNPDGSLPAAAGEVKALGELFPGSKVYLEGQASGDKLKGVQAPAVSYLHLATHGVLDPRDPRGSYLVMASGQKLTISDITAYRLDGPGADLNLVTLSACQTALGERNPDGSDLRSLADAFSFAGCRSVVASLWSVSDESTRDLMVEFYQALKAGQSKAEALRKAQLKVLANPRYAHPYYWSPFVLIGDWR